MYVCVCVYVCCVYVCVCIKQFWKKRLQIWEEVLGEQGRSWRETRQLAKLSVLMPTILKFKKYIIKPVIDKGPSKDFCIRSLLAQERLETSFFPLLCSNGSSLAAPCLILTDLFCLNIDSDVPWWCLSGSSILAWSQTLGLSLFLNFFHRLPRILPSFTLPPPTSGLKIDRAEGEANPPSLEQGLSIWFLNEGGGLRGPREDAKIKRRGRNPPLTGSTFSDSEDRAVFKVNWNKPVTSGAFCLQK